MAGIVAVAVAVAVAAGIVAVSVAAGIAAGIVAVSVAAGIAAGCSWLPWLTTPTGLPGVG